MRSRNKQITLDILTGMSATAAGKKYNITHQAAGRIVATVVKEARAKSAHAISGQGNTITWYKSIATRLIPIVHNHYNVSDNA